MPAPRSAKRVYKPGEIASVTGIYDVVHVGHREPHKATLIRGEEFPVCRTCKTAVSFTIVQQASHVTHDWDFAGPKLRMIKE